MKLKKINEWYGDYNNFDISNVDYPLFKQSLIEYKKQYTELTIENSGIELLFRIKDIVIGNSFVKFKTRDSSIQFEVNKVTKFGVEQNSTIPELYIEYNGLTFIIT